MPQAAAHPNYSIAQAAAWAQLPLTVKYRLGIWRIVWAHPTSHDHMAMNCYSAAEARAAICDIRRVLLEPHP
jgi:hypothetical protein